MSAESSDPRTKWSKKKAASQKSKAAAETFTLAPSSLLQTATSKGAVSNFFLVDFLTSATSQPPFYVGRDLGFYVPRESGHVPPLCGVHRGHAVRRGRPGRHGRRGWPGRHARKSEATGFHLRPAPHAHTPKIATPRCGGTSVNSASRLPAAEWVGRYRGLHRAQGGPRAQGGAKNGPEGSVRAVRPPFPTFWV